MTACRHATGIWRDIPAVPVCAVPTAQASIALVHIRFAQKYVGVYSLVADPKCQLAPQAVRQRISSMLNEEDKIDGLENVEVKVFK